MFCLLPPWLLRSPLPSIILRWRTVVLFKLCNRVAWGWCTLCVLRDHESHEGITRKLRCSYFFPFPLCRGHAYMSLIRPRRLHSCFLLLPTALLPPAQMDSTGLSMPVSHLCVSMEVCLLLLMGDLWCCGKKNHQLWWSCD